MSISTNDLKALLSHYGVVKQAEVDELLELARSARGGSFYDQYTNVLPPGFKEYLAYEASADIIRSSTPSLIPGLLQIEEYGRDVLKNTAGLGDEHVDIAWAVRQHRQELLYHSTPPNMYFVVDEAALRRQVGGPQVMARQLTRLKNATSMPHVSLQIMPFAHGATPGLTENFLILTFDDPSLPDLLHMEGTNHVTAFDDETDLIGKKLDLFEELTRRALSIDESKRFLDELTRGTTAAPSGS